METRVPEGTAEPHSAVRIHRACAARHEAMAALWEMQSEPAWAEFQRRCAHLEREAAEIEAARARITGLVIRSAEHGRRGGAARAEIRRLRADVERRTTQLKADDAALERERSSLRRHRNVQHERAPAERPAGDLASAAAGFQERARRLGLTLSRTAELLNTSAALAQDHASRLEDAGLADAAALEHQSAERTRRAAQRARLLAEGLPKR